MSRDRGAFWLYHRVMKLDWAGQFLRGLLVSAVLLGGRGYAHERWFYDATGFPTRLGAALSFPTILFVGGALLVTGLGWLLWRARGGRDALPGPERFGATPRGRALLYALIPAILGVHLAVPLLVNGVQGRLFSPNNVPPGAWSYAFGLVQTGVALSFFYGGFTRLAAVALLLLWLVGVPVVGLERMLENVHYLGFAFFFFFAGRGPFSVDRLLFPALEPPARLMRWAVPALRVGVGLSLITVAFTEKLANLPLARAFLGEYPLNFTGYLGFHLSDTLFILGAGTIELIIGLFLVFGLFPRAVILVAWLPFNLTLTYFNWLELVGHLPFYGAMALLLVWTPRADDARLWVGGLRRNLESAPERAQTPPRARLTS